MPAPAPLDLDLPSPILTRLPDQLPAGPPDPVPVPDLPALSGIEPRVRVGDVDGDQSAVMGLIVDLKVDSRGYVFVADHQAAHVRMYDPAGELVTVIGRPGAGPGEFNYLGPIAFDDAGLLHVLNTGNRRLSIFAIDGDAVSLVDEIPLPIIPGGFCLLGERIYLSGMYNDRAIHEIDGDGALIRSFGLPYAATMTEETPEAIGRIVRSFLTGGRLMCSAEANAIVLTARNRPDVRGFSPDPEVLWATELTGFSVAQPTPVPGGVQYRPDPRTGGAHVVLGAAELPGAWLLVQLGFSRIGSPARESRIDSRLLSIRSGEEVSRDADLPMIGDIHDGSAYGYRNAPFPEFYVTDVPGVGR